MTGMVLAQCILGKFLGVVCHCFPPYLYYIYIYAYALYFNFWNLGLHSDNFIMLIQEALFYVLYFLVGINKYISDGDGVVFVAPLWNELMNRRWVSTAFMLFLSKAQHPLMGQSLLPHEASRSHSDTPHWTMDLSDAETSAWQHTTLTTDKYPCPRRDSNPQYQQSSGRTATS